MAAEAAVSRVDTYLNYHYSRRDGYPDDPWDPNEWGHDARLKSITITDISARQEVTLTPSFDPDVLAYTVTMPIAPPTSLTFEKMDLLAPNPTYAYNVDNTVLTITMTAKDGTTQRVYTVTVDSG